MMVPLLVQEAMMAAQFESVLKARFVGPTSAFWLGLLAAFQRAANDDGASALSCFPAGGVHEP